MAVGTGNNQDELNRMSPAAGHAQLGTLLAQVIAAINAIRAAFMCTMLTRAGLVIKAGASAIVKAGSAFVATVNGTLVRKAANTDMSALAGTLATAKSAVWAFYISAAGTITTSAKSADANDHASALALLPVTPANLALIGFVVIDNATGSNFVGGTTALDTGSLTVTYYDSNGIPPDIDQIAALAGIDAR